jgi:hypothetical protein
VKAVADRELVSEATWLKRLVLREIRANDGGEGSGGDSSRLAVKHRPGREVRGPKGGGKPMLVRLRQGDRLLLDARADARGMCPATYASVLLRSHMRQLTPLPKDELLALKRSIALLASIGRNINQIAKAANQGGRIADSGGAEFRAMLKICVALRDNTKALLKANETSWMTGHAEANVSDSRRRALTGRRELWPWRPRRDERQIDIGTAGTDPADHPAGARSNGEGVAPREQRS